MDNPNLEHCGPVTVVFGTGQLWNCYGKVVKPKSNVVESPNNETGGVPLGYFVTGRGIGIYLKRTDQTADAYAHALGIKSSRIVVNTSTGAKVLSPSAVDTDTDRGAASIAWTTKGGVRCNLLLKLAQVLPTNAEIPVGPGQVTTADCLLACIDPCDGTDVPYTFTEGA
jgi:hypothetical protein